jgi:hypothetical protein
MMHTLDTNLHCLERCGRDFSGYAKRCNTSAHNGEVYPGAPCPACLEKHEPCSECLRDEVIP